MASVRVRPTAALDAAELRAIRRLLDDAFGGDFTDDDWDHTVGGRHVTVHVDGLLACHAAVVARTIDVAGRRLRAGYVEGVATAPGSRRRGLGSLAMGRVADLVRHDFEVGVLSTWSQPFYERLGWERWRGPTSVWRAGGRERSPDDDGAIMVLRSGPSADLDLTAWIACRERGGDDW